MHIIYILYGESQAIGRVNKGLFAGAQTNPTKATLSFKSTKIIEPPDNLL